MDRRYLDIPESLLDDMRLQPMRKGMAALALEERGVKADAYVQGILYHAIAPVCVLRRDPGEESAADTQLLYGEDFYVYGEEAEWYWGQAALDGYVGWVRKSHLCEGALNPTHHVMSRGTFLYSEADLKSQPVMKIPMASRVRIIGEETVRGTRYLETSGHGWLVAHHVRPLEKWASDFVMVGESMVGLTYLWAGRSTFGIDCSGFVQLAMLMAGIHVLRDTDMQEQTIGEPVPFQDDLRGLRRGDLVFWPGHVGMMRDEETLLHANGHTMTVFSEPLQEAVNRVSYLYDRPRAVRRPFALCA